MSQALNEVMFGKLSRLKDTWRYSAQPVIARENVAEHSFWTAIISAVIAMEIAPNLAKEVTFRALFHDIEECMTGDLVRDMKYASPEIRAAILKVETKFVDNLISNMGRVGVQIRDVWSNAKDDTLAGRIVSIADALSVISYCTKEQELGNTNLREIRIACLRLIDNKKLGPVGDPLSEIVWEALNESARRCCE